MSNPPIEQADSSSSASPSQTLEYAKRPQLGWVGRHRRSLLTLAVCIAIGIPLAVYRRPIEHRILWWYWSRQAAAHVMPTSMPMTVMDPVEAAKLLATNRDYVPASISGSTTQPAVAGAMYVPYTFQQLSKLDPRLNILNYGVPTTPTPIVFMGTLRRPDGTLRLVMITSPARSPWDFVVFDNKTRVLVLPPAGLSDSPPQGRYPLANWARSSPGNVRHRAVEPLSVKRDASDLSHLIFDCLVLDGGMLGINIRQTSEHRKLDAYLQNDDSVTFVFHETLGDGWPSDPLTFTHAGDPEVLAKWLPANGGSVSVEQIRRAQKAAPTTMKY